MRILLPFTERHLVLLFCEAIKDFVILDEAKFSPGHRFDVVMIIEQSVDFVQQGAIFRLQFPDPIDVVLLLFFHPVEVNKATLAESKPPDNEGGKEDRKEDELKEPFVKETQCEDST